MKLPGMFVALFGGLVFFAACEKKDKDDGTGTNDPNNPNTTLTKEDMLVAGKWQQIAGTATYDYNGKDTTIDIFDQMDECDKDDFILFANNGTGTIDEATNKCSDDQQVENFSWMLLDNDTRLALIDSNPDTFDVVEITTAQFKIQITKPTKDGPVTAGLTYSNIQ